MCDYTYQLDKFYEKRIKLPTDMRDMLLNHRTANANRLIARLAELHPKVRIGAANFQSQGSFAMDTVLQTRFTKEEYDIDYGVVIRRSQLVNEDGSEMTGDEARELVREALRDKRFNRQPKVMSNCVRVFYADEDDYAHHVDIPVYREFENNQGKTVMELAGENGWTISNPTRVNVWLEDLVEEKNKASAGSGSQMRRMIKWLKRFCRSRNADTDSDWDLPNGMKLTMLVQECFLARARDDVAFYDTLVSMKTRLAWNRVILNLADESLIKPALTKTFSDQNVLNLHDRIEEAIGALAVLHSSHCSEVSGGLARGGGSTARGRKLAKDVAWEGLVKGTAETITHPLKSLEEAPLSTALTFGGVTSLAGRGAGAAVRAAGRAGATGTRGTLARVGSTSRPALATVDDAGAVSRGAVKERRYSKDLTRKGAQILIDKYRERRHGTVKQGDRQVTHKGEPVLRTSGAHRQRLQRREADFEEGRTLAESRAETDRIRAEEAPTGRLKARARRLKGKASETAIPGRVARGQTKPSLEAAGNGGRRWMVAPAPPGAGQNPAYRPARSHSRSDLAPEPRDEGRSDPPRADDIHPPGCPGCEPAR